MTRQQRYLAKNRDVVNARKRLRYHKIRESEGKEYIPLEARILNQKTYLERLEYQKNWTLKKRRSQGVKPKKIGRNPNSRKDWERKKWNTDSAYRLKKTTSLRIRLALKNVGLKKNDSTSRLVGGIDNLKTHLESLLPSGWNWENHGSVWEIDHIIPLAKFNLSDPTELYKAFHFSNTQPLSCFDNRSKGAKIVTPNPR